ncbi:MAG: DUF3168 domain-containing protein [Parcubacteria group bacterium]
MRNSFSDVSLKALITKLLAVTALTAVVGTRISPPGQSGKIEPYVTVMLMPDRTSHGIGYSEPDSVTAQFEVGAWAGSYGQATDIVALIEKALDGESLTVTNWGVARLEGYGSHVRNYFEKDIEHFYGLRRYRCLLANQNAR